MATGSNSSSAYYNISNGKICQSFKAMVEGATERTTQTGKIVFEKFFDYIDGLITNIETRENEFGKQWVVTLLDQETGLSQSLQFNYSSGYAAAFLKALPNVDLSKKVKITPKLTIEGDKKKTTVFINQGGHACKWFYTKDNPNGLPELKQVKIKGKLTWDDSDVMEFLENMVKNDIKPKLKGSAVAAPVDTDAIEEDAPF
jgi:predicted DNA-binding transcriptional regulator AlpA